MMMDIRPIRTEDDYNWAISEIAAYFENEPRAGSPESDRFDVLSALIEQYEAKAVHFEPASPVDVIRFYMEQNGLTQTDLASVLGSRSRASEFLSGRRDLSTSMIAAIRDVWKIPADLLIAPRVAA